MDHKATSSTRIPQALRELVSRSPSSVSLLLSPEVRYGIFSFLYLPGARLITMWCGMSLQNHYRNECLEGTKFISYFSGDHEPLIMNQLLQLQQKELLVFCSSSLRQMRIPEQEDLSTHTRDDELDSLNRVKRKT